MFVFSLIVWNVSDCFIDRCVRLLNYNKVDAESLVFIILRSEVTVMSQRFYED
jgi:hypothetical protein